MTRQQIEDQLRSDNPTTTDDAGERHGQGDAYYEAMIEAWADAMEATLAELAPPGRKVWPSASEFLLEFDMEEMAAISLSTDATVAGLRLLLATWRGEVWSDDARVQAGLAALVATEIIDEARAAALVAV